MANRKGHMIGFVSRLLILTTQKARFVIGLGTRRFAQ
jgi:hypothetical protein